MRTPEETPQLTPTRLRKTSVLLAGFVLAAAALPIAFGSVAEAGTATVTSSLFPDVVTPTAAVDMNTNAVELGVRFQPAADGEATAIRYWKGAGSPAAQKTGHLWSQSGRLLASVRFSNESASGWQTAQLGAPVKLRAGRNYVVSYYAPQGGYAATIGFFATTGVTTPTLTAPEGTNGVYMYASRPAFPTQSWKSSNYWVDLVFRTSAQTTQGASTPTTPPTTTTAAPTTTTTVPPTTTTTVPPTTTTTVPPTTTTTVPPKTGSGGVTIGSGPSAMVFPEKPGLTVAESSLTPYTGPTSFAAGSTGTYSYSNCLITRQIRIDPTSSVTLNLTNCKIAVNVFDSSYGMIGKGGTVNLIHCLIDGTGFNDVTFPLILEGPSASVTYSEFTGNTDNARLGTAVNFQWNWIHNPKRTTVTGGAHSDGIEVYYGGRSTIAHNYIAIDGAEGANSSINITADFGSISNVTIDSNTMMPGGNYSLYVRSDGYCRCGTVSAVNVTNNRWFASSNLRWAGYYGVWSINSSGSVSSWAANTLTRTTGAVVSVTLADSQP